MNVNGISRSTGGPTHSQGKTIYRKNLELFGKYRFGFTPRFSRAIKNPDHILGRFFREVDFSKNKDIVDELEGHSPSLRNFLMMAFLDFIGVTSDVQKRINKVTLAEARAAMEVNKNLPSWYLQEKSQLEEILEGIPAEYRSIRFLVQEKGSRIALDFVDNKTLFIPAIWGP